MKKVLSLIVALTMVLSLASPSVFSAGETGYSDVDGTSYEAPVAILRTLGIMSGYTDGSFHPYATITRAEMAAIGLRLQGILDYNDSVSPEEVQYKDMEGHWAAAVVAYARSLGIIDGYTDGNFYPDEPVTYEQAIKIIVAALGYDYYAMANGGYPNGYIRKANELKIAANVGVTMGSYITRGDVAKIVYNSLTVDIMEMSGVNSEGDVVYSVTHGNNVLNTYFHVEKSRGIVEENGRTGISGGTTLETGKVRIGNEVLNDGGTNIGDYLGYYVSYYALENDYADNRTIISYDVESSKNNYISIDAESIENVSFISSRYVFEYWRNYSDKSTRNIKTSTTPLVIYNGVALTDYGLSDLNPDYGKVTFIDNDDDGVYDIVDILSYDFMLVLNVSHASGNVTAAQSTGARAVRLDPDSDDYSVRIMDANGNNVGIDQIRQNSVISFALSRDEGNTVRTAIVSNDSINGMIESIDSAGNYIINGKTYDAIEYMEKIYDFTLGDNGTFYLSHDGRIAGFDGEAKQNRSIGYFIDSNAGLRTGSGNTLKIVRSDGVIAEVKLASRVKLNGTTYSGNEVFEMINSTTNPLFGRHSDSNSANKRIADPLRAGFLYRSDASGNITEIVTVDSDELRSERRSYMSNNYYYSTRYHAFHVSDVRTYVTDSTIIFNSDDKASRTSDSQIYSVSTPAQFWENQNVYWPECDFYFIGDRDYADFAIFYDNYDVDGTSSLNYGVNRNCMYDALKIVDRVLETYNSDREIGYTLVYWEGGNSRTADFHEDVLSSGVMYRYGSTSVAAVNAGDDPSNHYWRRGDMVNIVRDSGKIVEVVSIFNSNAWNDPSDTELDGNREKNHRYLFPSGVSEIWSNWDAYGTGSLVQRYLVGRITGIATMRYFSTFDLRYSGGTLNAEPIEGSCYRLLYDGRGYLNGIEDVGNGALAENQLVLMRKNGTNGTIGCRVAESYILYEPEDFTATQISEYAGIYDDYFTSAYTAGVIAQEADYVNEVIERDLDNEDVIFE